MEVIFISGISMSFFIVVLLLTKNPKALTDKILAAWLAVIGIHLTGYYLYQMGYWEMYPHLVGTTVPFPLLYGPMLFLYTRYSIRNDQKLQALDYLHFAPAAAAYLYLSNFFFFYTAEEKRLVDMEEIPDFGVFKIVLMILILISGIGYSIVSFRLTLKHKQKINHFFSYHEDINLKWLQYCIISIGLVFLSASIVFVLQDALGVQFPINLDYISYLIIIGLIFYIGYFGIKHENIFTNKSETDVSGTGKADKTEKYKNSGMTDENSERLYKNLLEMMEDEKPYLQPKLSLAKLAEQLEISPNQLSQVINWEGEVNFYDFVNKYRVEEFIRQSHKNKNYSILALAYEAGFNSKSSFNYIFKKQKGISPSQYLSKIQTRQKKE